MAKKETTTGSNPEFEIVAETLNSRVTRLEALVRKIMKMGEIHWGKDINEDGKIGGSARIWTFIALCVIAAAIPLAVYAATAIWGVTSTANGTCEVTSTSGVMTLTVDTVKPTSFYICGTQVTASAAAINAAAAGTSSSVLLSNAVLKVYGSNVEVVAGGTLTVGASSTITVPAASIAAASIAAGTMANAMTISNATTKVYGSNVEVVAGGTLTVGAGGTVTVPADSVSLDAVNGITATAAEINLLTAYKATQIGSIVSTVATNANGGTNVVTFTCKDLAGTQMTGYNTFRFWISDSQYGAPAAVAGDVVISGGSTAEIAVELDKAVYVIQASNGVAVATITDDPGGTNWIHVTTSGGKLLTPIKSAFNIP